MASQRSFPVLPLLFGGSTIVLFFVEYFMVDAEISCLVYLLLLAGTIRCWPQKQQSPSSGDTGQHARPKERKEDPLLNWTRPTREECPVCLLPLPIDDTLVKGYSSYYSCCGSTICNGCIYDMMIVAFKDAMEKLPPGHRIKKGDLKGVKQPTMCPFCRNDEGQNFDALQREMELAKAGRHRAIWRIGGYHMNGEHGLRRSPRNAMKWFRRAAEAGSPGAANAMATCYMNGDIVGRDLEKALEYSHEAARLGRVTSFCTIGTLLFKRRDLDGGFLNFRKAVICGVSDEHAFNVIRKGFELGYITKAEYAYTLRENRKSADAMKSASREAHKELHGGG